MHHQVLIAYMVICSLLSPNDAIQPHWRELADFERNNWANFVGQPIIHGDLEYYYIRSVREYKRFGLVSIAHGLYDRVGKKILPLTGSGFNTSDHSATFEILVLPYDTVEIDRISWSTSKTRLPSNTMLFDVSGLDVGHAFSAACTPSSNNRKSTFGVASGSIGKWTTCVSIDRDNGRRLENENCDLLINRLYKGTSGPVLFPRYNEVCNQEIPSVLAAAKTEFERLNNEFQTLKDELNNL